MSRDLIREQRNKGLCVSRPRQLELVLDSKVRNALDAICPRLRNRFVDLGTILVTFHNGLFEITFRNACRLGNLTEDLVHGDVLLFLKVGRENTVNGFLLNFAAMFFGQFNQSMRVARVADVAAPAKVDAERCADSCEPLADLLSLHGAKFRVVKCLLVRALAGSSRKLRHELVGKKFDIEGVLGIRVLLVPELDGLLQLSVANKAPRAHSVGDNFDVEGCHFE
ncbi:hypothetical protein HC256_001809 [Beauveria bassiana]|nr:hypothetical protein HC256_001809 [Beauveria bassiana]